MAGKVNLKVPQRAVPVLLALRDLDEGALAQSLEVMTSEPAPHSVHALRQRLADSLDGEDDPEGFAEGLIGELFGLVSVAESHQYSLLDVAQSVATSPALKIEDEEEQTRFSALLASLLSSSAVRTLGRAAALAAERERVLHALRIVSDITPVFEDPDSEPVGVLLTHRLRLTYWDGGILDDVEIALTTSQLDELQNAIERANAKAESMRSMLGRLPLVAFEVDGEE